MILLYIFLIVLALAGIILGISYWTYTIAFRSPNKTQGDFYNIPDNEQYCAVREQMIEMIRLLESRPCERVEIMSFDGLRLSGRYYHVRDGAPLAICFHGYRGTSIRDFSGGSKIALESGQNVLLVDQRAHGESEGNTITFGIFERYDCLEWIYYAIERFGADVEILLYGVSMGASTVLMASDLELPEQVKGIVADCPYSSPKDIILKVAKDMHYPKHLAYPLIKLGARVFGGFDLEEITAEEAVNRAYVPILIIHGEDDRFVPPEMSECIADANPYLVERQTFPKAGHALSYITDYDRYAAISRAFTNKLISSI